MRPSATSAWGLELLVYGDLSYWCMNLYPYVSARRDACDAAWLDENGGDTVEQQSGARNSGAASKLRQRMHRSRQPAGRPHTLVA